MNSANASKFPSFTKDSAPTFQHRFAVGVAGFIGGWLGEKVGAAIGTRLPLVPRPIGRILGGTLGGYLGARSLIGVMRMLLKDAPPSA